MLIIMAKQLISLARSLARRCPKCGKATCGCPVNNKMFTTDCVWHLHGKGVFCNPVCDGFPYY